jgi:serine/threonine protein kinase
MNTDVSPPRVGKYQLVRILGKGAMGEVWLAEEEGPRNFRRRVAVKRLLHSGDMTDYAVESFVAEAQVIARLDHPNVVRLVEFGTEPESGGLYLVLDFVDGISLEHVLRSKLPLGPAAVAYVGREVARALDAVHSLADETGQGYGVVHRDVSPSNVLASRDGRIRLTDFGIARISGLGGQKTETGVFKGKLPYMPPEQARGEPFDGRADVFALGVTLFEFLLGRRLRRAETHGQLLVQIARDRVPHVLDLLPDAPARLAAAIDRATEFRGEDRHESAREFARELGHVLAELGPDAESEAIDEMRARVEKHAGAPLPALSRASASGSGSGSGIAKAAGSQTGAAALPSSPTPATGLPGVGAGNDAVTRVEHGHKPEVASAAPAQASPTTGSHVGAVATVHPPAPPDGRRARVALAVGGALALGVAAAGGFFLAKGGPTPQASDSKAPSPSMASEGDLQPHKMSPSVSVAPPSSSSAPEPAEAGTASGAPSSALPGPPSTVQAASPSTAPAQGPRTTSNAPATKPSASADATDPTTPGSLSVVVQPWGDVSVDGRSVGTTPLAPITLAPGPHSVTIKNGELGASRSFTVTVKPGQRASLSVNLQKSE